ncbi:MAG: DUF2798 domain-containing protein [Rhodobacteraceae bacterium]|nr:DUF2798 domain-containing protein [Paracoccaceae bacterium]
MIPAKYAPALFSLILSGLMSCIVTFIASAKTIGLGPETVAAWLSAWALAWPIAFLVAFLAGPMVRKLVAKLVVQPSQHG